VEKYIYHKIVIGYGDLDMKSNIDISNLFKKNQKRLEIQNKVEIIKKIEIRLVEIGVAKNIKEIEKKLEGLDELEKTVEKLNRILLRQEIIREMDKNGIEYKSIFE